jgi:septal ring factor EnvC (AmiA/AmiB activator)
MRFENKGLGPKGGTYLACDTARRGLGCEKAAWRYGDLEASFLAFVKELDLESLMRTASDDQRRILVQKELAALRGELATVQDHRDRTFELFKKVGLAIDYVGNKLNELEERRIALLDKIAVKEKERNQLSSEASGVYESKEQLKGLIERVQHLSGEDVYKLRAQIAARLKSLVSEITVAPLGSAPITRKVLALLKEQEAPDRNEKLICSFEQRLEHEHEHRRFFLVHLQG